MFSRILSLRICYCFSVKFYSMKVIFRISQAFLILKSNSIQSTSKQTANFVGKKQGFADSGFVNTCHELGRRYAHFKILLPFLPNSKTRNCFETNSTTEESPLLVKFMFSKKAQKNDKIFTVDLTLTKLRNIWFFSPLVPSKREKNILVLLSL